jgi:hypothetical protein
MAFDSPTNFTVGNSTTSVSGIGSLFAYGNYVTHGFLGNSILLLIFALVFLMSAATDKRGSFASASFITLIFSVYFVRIQIANPVIPFIMVVLTIVGFFLAKDGP